MTAASASRTGMGVNARIGVGVVLVLAAWWGYSRYGFGLDELKARQESLQAWVGAHRPAAVAGFFALYVVAAAIALPAMGLLTLAAGAIFGFVEAVVLVSFASTLGASLAFMLSRSLLRDVVVRRYPKRVSDFDAGVRRAGAHYLLTLRLIPAVPFFLINVLAGVSALRLRTFYWVSQVGMLPGTVAYVYAGRQLGELESVSDVLSPGLLGALVLLAALPWIARAIAAGLERRRAYGGFRRPRRFDYNLVVIGAGSAGLVSAYLGVAAGARVALIERDRMGGDCLNTGCVPSKTLLRTARFMAEVRRHAHYGIADAHATVDFAQVMARVRGAVASIAPHDSVERYESLGVDVVTGDARLRSPWSVEVGGRTLTARSIVIATGARPAVPPLDGLGAVGYLTSDTVWDLDALPGRLLVLGGGPIGCELGQAFARLGSHVTLVELGSRLMSREDQEASAAVAAALQEDGVDVRRGHRAVRVEARGSGGVLVCRTGEGEGGEVAIPFDRLLVALGRTPRTEGLGLEELGIEVGAGGTVRADAWLRTTLPNIFVAGDAAGPYQFTHTAAHQAWYAVANALLAPFWRFRADYRVIPRVTFTEPEVAQVGLTVEEAQSQGVEHEVTRYDLASLDRAIAEGEARGFIKVLTPPGSDRILGATVVGAHAGELLAPLALAMRHGLGLRRILGTVHAYPTFAEAVRSTAGAWQRAHPPARLLASARRYLAFRRR